MAAFGFEAWLNDFFSAYYRHRPVNATFIGNHDHDHRLPDFSENGVGECVDEMDYLLTRLAALPPEQLTPAGETDRILAKGYLRIQSWEFASKHFQRGNPSLYTGEAIFAIIGLFLTPYAPLTERIEAAIERMQQLPRFLAQCQVNVRSAPRQWTLRAINECDGALKLLSQGIDRLIDDEAISEPALRRAADVAAAAFADLRNYLQVELLANLNSEYACGEEAFALHLNQGHFLDRSGDEIAAHAEEIWTRAEAALHTQAEEFGAESTDAALAQLADYHPSAESYYAAYGNVWQACREHTISNKLLTWPDFPIEYVPRPGWSRAAAPHLYFLFYRSPAAFNRPTPHQYLVAPLEAGQSATAEAAFLRVNNNSVIKLNHVVHHGGVGHHVQNWHAVRSQSKIGRIAAVDCASRIAMYCGATMAEGWACYATALMGESGFLTPLERYAEHQSLRRMCTRAIVDVRLHQGRMTLEEAVIFYQQRAAMNADAARDEAVKNSMFPGAALIYLIGTETIRSLRSELSARLGMRFDLRRFHDEFLAYGSIPVSLIRKQMLHKADQERSTADV